MGDLSWARSKFGKWCKRHGAYAGKQGGTLSSRLGTRRVLSDQPTEPADDLTMTFFACSIFAESGLPGLLFFALSEPGAFGRS